MCINEDNQEEINELYITLSRTISPDRLGAYLTSAGFDHQRALKLYLWNAKLCGAFYLPLQATEIGLRNAVNGALVSIYGPEWWQDTGTFWNFADNGAKGSLGKVFTRIRNMGMPLTTPQVVAGMSFGFWVNLLDSYYNIDIWSHELTSQFPNLPDNATRESLKNRAAKTADLRNRISHHEPIHKMNISVEYSQVMELLSWLCPNKKEWIRTNSEVPKIMREKPK